MDLRSLSRQKLFLLVAAVLVVFLLLGIIISLIYASLNKNQYGEGIVIKNFNDKVKNLPKERVDSISAVLYKTVKLNMGSDQKVPEVHDAIIRDGSASQDQPIKNVQYYGTFIVDIESLKQSYRVQYSYSIDKDDVFVSGYASTVSCLKNDELKYGDFKCKDLVSGENADVDPIVYKLPYEALRYRISAIQGDDKVVSLKIDLILSNVDLRNKDANVQKYTSEALSWLESQGFDPKKYKITYSY